MKKVFIDGSAGTTGLRIYQRLENRKDIELIKLSEADRKDKEKRREAINKSDITFLCLPDEAAIEAVSLCSNPNTVIIDTSTAHRKHPDFVYGLPELSADQYEKIKTSKRIAVPGCHAGGFVALVYPLIKAGILDKNTALFCHSITGYSGGGKKMIAEYEGECKTSLMEAPRQYGLTQNHKHLKEMKAVCMLEHNPIFCPVVSDFYSGMVVTVPLFAKDLKYGSADDIKKIYKALYNGRVVKYTDEIADGGFLSGAKMSGLDSMEISVLGNDERILLCAAFDNLGHGASGCALECMNIVLGFDVTDGLEL
ncbi:MAG: N-acetyl-gamma-glutamyl-phosphate reductase [Ruminococcaceae bacterium]|nr:N-acetyl-gamma-glutamyl-phosphate reductase [Oscillospiraceae bacterium]